MYNFAKQLNQKPNKSQGFCKIIVSTNAHEKERLQSILYSQLLQHVYSESVAMEVIVPRRPKNIRFPNPRPLIAALRQKIDL
jgi:hypothetical protein